MNARVAILPTQADPSGARVPTVADYEQRVELLTHAVAAGGGTVVDLDDANAVVWMNVSDPDGLHHVLDQQPGLQWVQLPWVGVESYHRAGIFQRELTFTNAKRLYAPNVAEHAIGLIISLLRNFPQQARHDSWHPTTTRSLVDKRVTILGGGGITSSLIPYLRVTEGTTITVVRKRDEPLEGADRTVTIDRLHDVLPETDVFIVTLALTEETRGIVGADQLSLLPPHAILVNVARGQHVDQDALVDALRSNALAGAALDVTDPEPLPEDHPLWTFDNVLITSHSADSVEYITQQLAKRVQRNVAHFVAGEPLEGEIDRELGY
jgi:phosphoglycerate dehydrogenase-like enzyme